MFHWKNFMVMKSQIQDTLLEHIPHIKVSNSQVNFNNQLPLWKHFHNHLNLKHVSIVLPKNTILPTVHKQPILLIKPQNVLNSCSTTLVTQSSSPFPSQCPRHLEKSE